MDDDGGLLVAALAGAHPAHALAPFHSKVDRFVWQVQYVNLRIVG